MPSDIWDKTVGTLIFLAAFAIGLHGLVTETGLAGWIVLAQHQLFGWSSTKLTMLLSMIVLGFAGLTLWAGFQKLRGRRDAGAQAMRVLAGTPAGARELTRRELAGWLAAGIALTWAIGAGAWWWTGAVEIRDRRGEYLQTMLIVCAIVSGALVVSGLAVMAGWAIRRRRLGY